jgi:arsenate reductase
MNKLYYYKNCSTSKAAKKYLDENNIDYSIIHLDVDPPNYNQINELIIKSGLGYKKFLNTSGKIYREERIKDKISSLNEGEAIKLFDGRGMLIKRPILETNNSVLVGFKLEEWKDEIK